MAPRIPSTSALAGIGATTPNLVSLRLDDPLFADLNGELAKLQQSLSILSAEPVAEPPIDGIALLIERISSQAQLLEAMSGPNQAYLGIEQAFQRAARIHPGIGHLQPLWNGGSMPGYLTEPGDLDRLADSPNRLYELALGVLVVLESISILIACETTDDEVANAWSDESARLLGDLETALTTLQAN